MARLSDAFDVIPYEVRICNARRITPSVHLNGDQRLFVNAGILGHQR